jgi:predicted TIM-barrel fold metal-dependent hydrolase
MRYQKISADSHINEHPDLWQARLPAKLRSRGPRTVDSSNGGQGWTMEGQDPDPVKSGLALGPTAVVHRSTKRYDRAEFRNRFDEQNLGNTAKGVRYDDILAGSFDPAARVKEQQEDAVDAEILYSNPLLWAAIKELQDQALKRACFRAYNDWIAEFSSHAPERLVGTGLVPPTGIDDALAETRRCIEELGLKGITLESFPNGSPADTSADDDRLWAYIEETGVPVGVHVGFSFSHKGLQNLGKREWANRGGRVGLDHAVVGAETPQQKGEFPAIARRLITGGVFERFPDLKFVGAEVNCGWIPTYLRELDRAVRFGVYPGADLPLSPSEYFRRNVYATFIGDYYGVRLRDEMLDNIMWSTDFPHSVSNWPIDSEIADDMMQQNGVPADEADLILWKTCADVYHLDYDAPQNQCE